MKFLKLGGILLNEPSGSVFNLLMSLRSVTLVEVMMCMGWWRDEHDGRGDERVVRSLERELRLVSTNLKCTRIMTIRLVTSIHTNIISCSTRDSYTLTDVTYLLMS